MSSSSRTSIIKAANTALIVQSDLEAVAGFFAPDYVAHLTDGQKLTGGHAAIRKVIEMYRKAFTDLEVDVEVFVEEHPKGRIAWREMLTSQFNDDDLIEQEWIISDLAEQLLLTRKKKLHHKTDTPMRSKPGERTALSTIGRIACHMI